MQEIRHSEIAAKEPPEHKLRLIGTVHTHPVQKKDPEYMQEVNRHMSRCDHRGSAEAGELISAVMPMWITPSGVKRSAIEWWLPQAAIKVKRVA